MNNSQNRSLDAGPGTDLLMQVLELISTTNQLTVLLTDPINYEITINCYFNLIMILFCCCSCPPLCHTQVRYDSPSLPPCSSMSSISQLWTTALHYSMVLRLVASLPPRGCCVINDGKINIWDGVFCDGVLNIAIAVTSIIEVK